MIYINQRIISIIAVIIIVVIGSFLGINTLSHDNTTDTNNTNTTHVVEDGQYCSADEVATYIKQYHKLPSNYITKKEAQKLGWEGGSLEKYAPGKSIGGDVFTNRQKILPSIKEKYIECDIDANGTSRGAKRIVYSTKDYKVYYTTDHYKTFNEI